MGDDGKVLVWQVPAWHGRALVDGGPAAKGLAVAANGQVAVGRVDGTLQLWSSTAATSPRAVRLAKQGVETLAYGASDKGMLAVGFNDGTIQLLKVETSRRHR